MDRSQRSGFSLIELLTVIGIVAILIAMLLPTMNQVRESAKTLQCASNLRQIGQAIFAYAASNRGYLPVHSNWHNYPKDGNPTDPWGPGWIAGITPYIGVQPDSPLYTCPSFPGDNRPITYFLECRWMHLQEPPLHTFPMSSIRLSSMYILSGDVTSQYCYVPPFGTAPYSRDNIDKDDSVDDPAARCLIFFGEAGGYDMHRAGNNILFADGHVQAFRKFDRNYMSYNPHVMQDWNESTGE